MNSKILKYHSVITNTALGLSKTFDKLVDAPGPNTVAELVRTGKAQLRVLIDMGLEIGQLLEEAESEDPTSPVNPAKPN